MLKQTLVLSLFFVLSSRAMDQETNSLKLSRNDIMDEFYLASKESRSPSPIVVDQIEKMADEAVEQDDSDLLVPAAQHLKKETLLRMSDGCLGKIRANSLAGKPQTNAVAILSAINTHLQK